MATFNISEKWNNGHPRTLTGHGPDNGRDPDDDKIFSAAGEDRKVTIDGQGHCNISGDRVRIYALYNNYDSVLSLTLKPNFEEDDDDADCSLKLRSRHQESNPKKNRFGGYGLSISLSEVKCKRENFHNNHTTLGSKDLSESLQNDREYGVRFTCKDAGSKVNLMGEIDYGNGFIKVLNVDDNNPKDYMVDRQLYDDKSYLWIRNNGMGDITVKDVKLELL
jgi:hypothetical protein